jgi:GNAT superfamily N-acetyltransferase
MGTTIRPATPEDADAACAVLRRSIQECCSQDHQDDSVRLDAWLGNKTPGTVGSWIASPTNHMLVAVRDGALVGVALVTQAGKLSLCYVLPEAQHCGVGKALLEGVESKAREWGIGTLSLKSTAGACDFFARNGYINGGKEKTCYGLECDLFWKKLNAAPGFEVAAGKRFCNCTGQ